MSEDRVEDLKLATSDTCAWLMRWRSGQDSPPNVVISVSPDGDGLQVVVESDRPGPAETKPRVPVEDDDEVHLGLDLIEALTGEIRITEEESATTVTFSLSLEAQTRPLTSEVPLPGDKHQPDG